VIAVQTKLNGGMIEGLDKFADEIRETILFSGVAAMAKVIYDEAREQCPVSEKGHWFHGTHQKYYFDAGTLKASIYRVYSPEKSNGDKKLYRISWNHKKAPYGYMVEFGTSRAPAHPFMRPAFDRINDAIAIGKARMAEKMDEL